MGGSEPAGRERELGCVRALLGAGGALLVRGSAGIGKSALLDAAADIADERGMVVLRTGAVQSEARLPFAGLHALLRPVLPHVDALPGPQRNALLSAFGMSDDPAPDPFLIALAALELLSEAASHAPLVLLADDAHWLDGATADVLAFVARRLGDDRIAIVAALRDGDPPGVEGSPALAEAGWPQECLGPLDDDAAGELLDRVAPDLDDRRRARILEAAGGNPLALSELPRAPADDAPPVGPALVPLTARLERTFAARASGLPAASRALLLVAAANDGDTLAEVLQAGSAVAGRALAVADLTPAIAMGLVDTDGPSLRFRHPLVRSAVYQAAPLAQRHVAHAALATTLAAQPDRQVWHRVACATGPDDRLAADLETAAERAQRRGAADVALAAFDRAARFTADPFRRGVRLLRTTELAAELGRPDLVAESIAATSGLDLAPAERIRLAWLRELYDPHAWSGADRLEAFADIAQQMLEAGLPEEALKALITIAVRVHWANAEDAVRDRILEVADRLPLPFDHPGRIAVLALADPEGRGAEALGVIARYAIAPSDDPGLLRLLGSAATAIGAFDLAPAFLVGAVAGLREQGRLGALAQAQVSMAWSTVHTGALHVGLPAATEAVRLADETGQPRWRAVGQIAHAALEGLRGDEERAEALIADAEATLIPMGANPMLALAALARGKTALAAGRHSDAFFHLLHVFDPQDSAYMPYVRPWGLADIVDAAVHAGYPDEAGAIVAALEPIARRSRSPQLDVGLDFARALLAPDHDAEPIYQAGLSGDLATWPLMRARMLLAYGTWLRRRRRVGESRALLRAAGEAFEALGIATWAERARQELRASGESIRRHAPEARDELTPQEFQIAEMAASGLTNREIGQRLYLSHRTVGSHLYRIFPKLGVSSRADLRRALRAPSGEPHEAVT
jgi:DNA-binding CsgD family transcriptional regulator